MCGINGFNFKDEGLIQKMNEATKHRGPDGVSFFVNDNVSLGHNLLAIMETPEKSLQPLVSPDQRYALTYNGEIYNYLSLRKELEKSGDQFKTNSDTEVLFKGLIRYGSGFLPKLDGMFAFAFYDKNTNELLLARDSLGMKPLYYYSGSKFIFSSELRGIFVHDVKRVLDHEGLAIYLSLGYIPGHKTLLQNISKLSPGQYATLDLHRNKLQKKWFGFRKSFASEKFEGQKLREIIAQSVTEHTMGLRPFGIYLSGGLDSTIILHELAKRNNRKFKTYTTKFDVPEEKFNEDAKIAAELCRKYGVENEQLLVKEKDFIDAIEPTIETMEEPRYNYSATTYWLMAQMASQDATVVLSGNGGDELFMGYSKYQASQKISALLANNRKIDELDFQTVLDSTMAQHNHRLGQLQPARTLDRWIYLSKLTHLPATAVTNPELILENEKLAKYIDRIGGKVIEKTDLNIENRIASLDRLFWLADEEFMRTDKIAMHFGMEGRFPLVASRLVQYANCLASNEKLHGGQSKYVLREAYRDHLPNFITNKEKTGWHSPVALWMGSQMYDIVNTVLSSKYYPETGSLFNFESVIHNYLPERKPITTIALKHLWPIFSFQIWAKMFKIKLSSL